VIEKMGGYVAAGAKGITLRPTSWNQREQFERIVTEVLPAFRSAVAVGGAA
jgi:uncharacterized membrane protein